jgi:hypothetical protein
MVCGMRRQGKKSLAKWLPKVSALGSVGIDLGSLLGEQRHADAPGIVLALFDHGMIVMRPGGRTAALWGPLYQEWRREATRGRWLLPIADAFHGDEGGLLCRVELAGGSHGPPTLLSHHPILGTFVVSGEVLTRWDAAHRRGASLGYPTGKPSVVRSGKSSLYRQRFRRSPQDPSGEADTAIASWSGGTFCVSAPVLRRWLDTDGRGRYWPLGDATSCPDTATCIQHFLHVTAGTLASICWHPRTGAWWIAGSIRDKWYQLGASGGAFGPPIEDAWPTLDGRGRIQRFSPSATMSPGAAIASQPDHGTFGVQGSIFELWAATGYESGAGLPECDEMSCCDGRGWFCQFLGAARSRIYRTAEYGTIPIRDPFLRAWYELGAERSALGYPTRQEEDGPAAGSRRMRFENGSMLMAHDGKVRVQLSQGGRGRPWRPSRR